MLPLEPGLPASDIDVLCHAPDPIAFSSAVWQALRHRKSFAMRQRIDRGRPVIASFEHAGWPFEIFGSVLPIHEQPAWQHFLVERRLLSLGGPGLHEAVMRRRAEGRKTEPAFAACLGLRGDPYLSMLEIARRTDAELMELLLSRASRLASARSPSYRAGPRRLVK